MGYNKASVYKGSVMKFVPYHKDDLKVFKAIEFCPAANTWRTIDIDTSVYQLYRRHGMLNFTESDLLFAKLNTIAVFGDVSQDKYLYIMQQAAMVPRFGDDALQRIATTIVDPERLLNIEPHGMVCSLRRLVLAFVILFAGIEVKQLI